METHQTTNLGIAGSIPAKLVFFIKRKTLREGEMIEAREKWRATKNKKRKKHKRESIWNEQKETVDELNKMLTAGLEPATLALLAPCSTDWAMRAFMSIERSA